jgi:large repetitive protein
MRFRFVWIVTLLVVGVGVFAGVAHALDFEAEEEPGFTGTAYAPVAEVGQDYSYEIGTAGRCFPHDVEIDLRSSPRDAFPPGLTLRRVDEDTYVVEGNPTRAGDYRVWLIARDQCGTQPAELEFVFHVRERTWAITTQSLPTAAAGSPYSFTLQAGGTATTSATRELVGGSLPAGLTLAPNGMISVTPNAPGSSTFTVRAIGAAPFAGNHDTRQLTLNVAQALSATLSGTVAEVGVRVRSSLVAAGGVGPYTWATSSLPPGLTLGTDGTRSRVPTRAGTYTVAARLTDSAGNTVDVEARLVVRAHVRITTSRLKSAVAQRAYRARIGVRGGVGGLRWAITRGSLPRGLRLVATTGTIVGKPSRAGTFRVTVRVRDALGATSTRRLVLRVR